MVRVLALLASLMWVAGPASAESFVELGGLWSKADTKGVLGGQIDRSRADVTSVGGYFGAAQQINTHIGWEVGYQFRSVDVRDTRSTDFYKSDSLNGGVKFNSAGDVQGFIRLGLRVHMAREQLGGVSRRSYSPSLYVAPGITFNTGEHAPQIHLWASRSSAYSKSLDDWYGYTQAGVTLGIPIDW